MKESRKNNVRRNREQTGGGLRLVSEDQKNGAAEGKGTAEQKALGEGGKSHHI